MAIIDEIVNAALAHEALKLRSLTQEFLHTNPSFGELPKPVTNDPTKFALAAAIVELLAQQAEQKPPVWTAEAQSVSEPIFLLKSAEKMKRLRQLCLEKAPLPLKKRGFYAPPNYLNFV